MVNNKEGEIVGIIRKALDIDKDRLTMDSSAENVEEWDSLGHLGILTNLDIFFNGQIAGIKEMATADSVKKILQLLKSNNLL